MVDTDVFHSLPGAAPRQRQRDERSGGDRRGGTQRPQRDPTHDRGGTHGAALGPRLLAWQNSDRLTRICN